MILNAIPQDDWVSATRISEKIGITPQAVGVIISKSLIPVYVEKRRRMKKHLVLSYIEDAPFLLSL